MTVGTTESVITVLGNGVTSTFSYPFEIPTASDAVVTFTDASGTQTVLLSTQYTITGLGVSTGGTVTYPLSGSPITSGTSITIQRVLPLIQTTSIQNQGPTFASIEAELDYEMMCIQQVAGATDRAIHGPPTDPVGLNYEVPAVSQRAGQMVSFDASGNVIVAQPTGTLVSAAMQPVVQAGTVRGALELLGGIVLLGSIASLRAFNDATPPGAIYVEGYYTAGDDGAGMFAYVSSDTTSTDNGGTIIVDASSRRWYRQNIDGWATFEMFGAKGDGTTDDTTSMQSTITAVQGTKVGIRMMRKQYLVSSTLNATAPITLEGVGNGAGPGVVDDTQCSQILCAPTFTSGNVIVATTYYSCQFRNFCIAGATGLAYTSPCPRSSGYGIVIAATDPSTTVNLGSRIEDVTFSGVFSGVYLAAVNESCIVRGCYFQAWGSTGQAIYADANGGTHEVDFGSIEDNEFFGNTQDRTIVVLCGYGSVTGNKFLLSSIAFEMSGSGSANIGKLTIQDNSFEENAEKSIYITSAGKLIASIQIQGNQFSNITADQQDATINILLATGGGPGDIYNVDISGNNFASVMNFATNPAFINIFGNNMTVHNNRAMVQGGACFGVIVQDGSKNCSVTNNQWDTIPGGSLLGAGGYLISDVTCVVVDQVTRGINVAALASWGNGSTIYVTDGKATDISTLNFVVTGGGSGCIAWRMAGAWLTIQTT